MSSEECSEGEDGYYLSDELTADKVSFLDLLDPFAVSTQLSRKINTTVRERSKQLQTTFNANIRKSGSDLRTKIKTVREEDLEKLKRQVLARIDKVEKQLSSEAIVTLSEKLTFAFGLLNVFALGYIMGSKPEWFHCLYTVESCLLLPIRFYTYKRKDYHYFLADLCYFANILNLLFIWAFPGSVELFVSCYALAFGTLSWAVITWRNSLVLHSLDKTTSTFIHVLPPTVFHVITHQLDAETKSRRFPAAVELESWRFAYSVLWSTVAYFVWQSLYHYFITVGRKEKIKSGARVTSFEWLRKSYGKTRIGKLVNELPEPYPVIAFTAIQYSFQLFTMMLCPLWYAYSYLSALFLTVIFFTASYNGATYYIDIFGKRFQKQLLKLERELEEKNQS
ncbi:glycerophosphocholine acyltransferase 1 [Trichomonascus vanleenenianus]|uniref:glycerophosphocholine acyltransferase n=1 Tax=Trichomonascus vanleenenianus TaxID=2268995 RepID=UPI003ECA6162